MDKQDYKLKAFKSKYDGTTVYIPEYFPNDVISNFMGLVKDKIVAENQKMAGHYFMVIHSENNLVFRFFNKEQIKKISEKDKKSIKEVMTDFFKAQTEYGIEKSTEQFGMTPMLVIEDVGTLDFLINNFK